MQYLHSAIKLKLAGMIKLIKNNESDSGQQKAIKFRHENYLHRNIERKTKIRYVYVHGWLMCEFVCNAQLYTQKTIWITLQLCTQSSFEKMEFHRFIAESLELLILLVFHLFENENRFFSVCIDDSINILCCFCWFIYTLVERPSSGSNNVRIVYS